MHNSRRPVAATVFCQAAFRVGFPTVESETSLEFLFVGIE
jgi:hypothetical protein